MLYINGDLWTLDNDTLLSILRIIFFSPQTHPALIVMLAIFTSACLALSSCWPSQGERSSSCSELLAGCSDCLHIPSRLRWGPSTRKLSVLFLTTTFCFCALISQRKEKVDNRIFILGCWHTLHSYWHALSIHS